MINNLTKSLFIDKAASKIFDLGINSLRSKFTISLRCTTDFIVVYNRYIELLKKIDKNYKRHIAIDYNQEYIDGLFIIDTHNNAKIIVYGYPKIDKDNILYILDMYIIGPNSLNIMKKIKGYVNNSSVRKSESINLYEISGICGDKWTSIKSYIDKRRFDTLFFNNNIKEEIMNHIDNWQKSAYIFNERGLIHKTGILVYGKAGTGKSTLAKAIASELDYDLVSIDTSTFDNINLIELTNAINNDNIKVVIFIDEIDAIFKSRDDEDATDKQKTRVTKLLSFLDGVNSPNNCIFVATTNYYNKLDSALTRKGRFDKIIELTDINKDTAFKMCKSFGLSDDSCKNIIEKYNTDLINPAELQDNIITIIRKELNEKE